jgi:aspartate 1-decarboxylase
MSFDEADNFNPHIVLLNEKNEIDGLKDHV